MPYAALADLVPFRLSHKDLVELTDDGTNEINQEIVSAALEEASGTVESYCRSRYLTPLQSSDVVKARTIDITVYLLFSRKRNGKPTELTRQRYDDAIKFLEGVAKGTIQLDQPVTAVAAQASAGGPVRSKKRETFSNRNLMGFK